MNKKVLRAGAVSAVAAGIGAAAVMAGKRRSKKEEENSDYRNTELGKFAKTARVFIIPMVTMRLLQDRKSRKELKKRALI